jgi:long-chain acyl-CoA synthetase
MKSNSCPTPKTDPDEREDSLDEVWSMRPVMEQLRQETALDRPFEPIAPKTGASAAQFALALQGPKRTSMAPSTNHAGGATIASLYLARIESDRARTALRVPHGDGWSTVTWGDLDERVRALSAALVGLGVAPGDVITQITSTRREWLEVALAAWCAGAAISTLFPTATPEETAHALALAETTVVVCEDLPQVLKVIVARDRLPKLKQIICIEQRGLETQEIISFDALLARGRYLDARYPNDHQARARRVRPDDLAALVFTSGTTGTPKGAELTHRAFGYVTNALAQIGALTERDTQLLWLPMAHSFGTLMAILPLRIGFETALDGRVDRLLHNLRTIRPTFTCAVPRIFEKAYAAIKEKANKGAKRRLLDWAISKTHRSGLADRLIFTKIRDTFGGRMRFFISGGAPLSPDIATFFEASGMPIHEGYGMTEGCAASFVNTPAARKTGSVGKPLPGTEVKIAENGEILIRSPGLMRGYRGLPELNAGMVTEDGWLKTGDAGELDEEGFLFLTDRLKDLIKTSTGRYIAPQRLEARLKGLCPFISQVIVHGDRRPFCSALITVDASRASAPSVQIEAEIKTAIDQLNRELASYARIRKFVVLATDLSVEAGEVTPSLKVRRRAVEERHRAILEELYDDELRSR